MRKNFYIIGAGISGISLGSEILKHSIGKIEGYLDDDIQKIGSKIHGISVFGKIKDYLKTLDVCSDYEFVICMPSDFDKSRRIYLFLKNLGFKNIKYIPPINKLFDNINISDIQEFNFEDILIRQNIEFNINEDINYLEEKNILITGAGGSIGSEICRQILKSKAKTIYLLGHGENSIYLIEKELNYIKKQNQINIQIIPLIGSIQDKNYIDYIFKSKNIDIVFHTAAYKHVPLSEKNPISCIKNNVFGTQNLVLSCIKNKVKKFVLISTDKAVKPSSVYGVSKNITEKIVLSYAGKNSNFMIVRFGNVIGARGSVLPLFKSQIQKKQNITITHKDMKRYFITISEAVFLALKAGKSDENKKLYLLDMGKALFIRDIARQMLDFYGYDLKIEYVGLRQGEKIDEDLFDSKYENLKSSKYKKINEIEFTYDISREKIDDIIRHFYNICFCFEDKNYMNEDELKKIISNYYV